MRAITYARYSSDLQRDASIADQQRSCREFAAARGWTVVGELSDAAMSGSTMFRPGVQALIRAVKDGRCDIVLCEGIDRLSRDLADTAAIFKQLRYARVTLHTILEGPVTSMHVGLKGTMNEMYLAELGVRTHRGQEGRVLAGKIAGGNSYGYRLIPGRLGEREIDESQAVIVRRIFQEYADGRSSKSIAIGLNRDGIAGPRSFEWAPSSIHGQAGRGVGILNNEIYVGRLVWDRLKWVTHPDTGRRLPRMKPRDTWKTVDVPHLRIVNDELWLAVKTRQSAIRRTETRGAVKGQRPRYLLSGLAKCAVCGASFTIGSHGRLRCFNRSERGTCSNARRIDRTEIERRVLTAMRAELLNPGYLKSFAAGYAEAMEQWRREQLGGVAGHKQELARVERRRKAIVEAIADGFRSEALRDELELLDSQRVLLISKVAAADAPAIPKRNMAALFREKVSAIAGDVAAGSIRRFIDRIVIPPGQDTLRVHVNLHLGAIGGCGGPQLPEASTVLVA
ncbi:MAG TPA: recombinase family protein [Burkholderiales bacterium]|nr:recombinase family protein [Burkholderiales bacterium]